jgi:hypothetical protein
MSRLTAVGSAVPGSDTRQLPGAAEVPGGPGALCYVLALFLYYVSD